MSFQPAGPSSSNFVRAEMLPSGYLIRPCEGGGSMIHIVDHVDLDAWRVPEVLRPLYESPKILAQKTTIVALRHIRQIAQETSGEIPYGGGRQPAVLRTFSQRLSKGFNDAVNGFGDDGWSLMGSDGMEDVTIAINSSPAKLLGSQANRCLWIHATAPGLEEKLGKLSPPHAVGSIASYFVERLLLMVKTWDPGKP